MKQSADGSSSKFNISKREENFCGGESFEGWVDLSFNVCFRGDFLCVIVVNTSYVTVRLSVTTKGQKNGAILSIRSVGQLSTCLRSGSSDGCICYAKL
jgi:hypothetical protein